MKVLWLVPKWTFPVNDGARVATDSLLRNTIAPGAVMDVVCLAGKNEVCNEEDLRRQWQVRDVHILRRKLPDSGPLKLLYFLGSLLSAPLMPLTFASYNDPGIREKLYSLLERDCYDIIVLDGLHLGTLFLKGSGPFKGPRASRIVYRAHNIEADLWKKAQEKSGNVIKRLILKYQAMLVEKVERRIISGVDAVAAIAQEDLEAIKENFPDKALKLVPLGMNFNRPLLEIKTEGTKFLFIGRLDWPPNRDGLTWILREVWTEVVKRRPGTVLIIAGTGDGSWLDKYRHLPNLEIKGFVKDVQDAYEDCHFTIVPITYGSGTRIKVIESFVMNRRLISTQSGVQGADLRASDFIHAESTEDWIRTLSSIHLDEEQRRSLADSREYVLKRYCEKQIGKEFYDWISTFS